MSLQSDVEISEKSLSPSIGSLKSMYGLDRDLALSHIFSLKLLNNSEKTELFRFYSSLLAFDSYERKNTVAYTGKEIWYGWLDNYSEFVDLYDDTFNYSVREAHSVSEHYFPKTERSFKYYNEYFSHKAMPKRHRTKCRLDYYVKPYDLNKDRMAELKSAIGELLPETVVLPSDFEVLSTYKATSSYDRISGKKSRHYKLRDTFKGFGKSFEAIHTDLNVYPSGERCGIIIPPDTLSSISWCSLFLRRVLDHVDGAVLCDNPFIRNKRIKECMDERPGHIYVLPDIEKSGIMIPREIIKVCEEALVEKYPHFEKVLRERFSVYQSFRLLNEKGEVLPATRGVGLGMAAEIVTIVELAIVNMIKPIGTHIRAYQFHDDQVVTFKESKTDLAEAFVVETTEVHEELGVPLSGKKTFLSTDPIFLEEYRHPFWKNKAIKGQVLLGCAFAFPDIRLAKEYVSQLSPILDSVEHKAILTDLTNWWGFEFYQEEALFDFTLGGWLANRDRFLNPSLVDLYSRPDLLQQFGIASKAILSYRKIAKSKPYYNKEDRYFADLPRLENLNLKPNVDFDWSELPDSLVPIFMSRQEIKASLSRVEQHNLRYDKIVKRYRKIVSFLEKKISYSKFTHEEVREQILQLGDNFVIPVEEVITVDKYPSYLSKGLDLHFLKREALDSARNFLIDGKICTGKKEKEYIPGFVKALDLLLDDISPYRETMPVSNDNFRVTAQSYQYASNPIISLTRYYEDEGDLPLTFLYWSKPKSEALYDLCGIYLPEIVEKSFETMIQIYALKQGVTLNLEKLHLAMEKAQELKLDVPEPEYHCIKHPPFKENVIFDTLFLSDHYDGLCEICNLISRIESVRDLRQVRQESKQPLDLLDEEESQLTAALKLRAVNMQWTFIDPMSMPLPDDKDDLPPEEDQTPDTPSFVPENDTKEESIDENEIGEDELADYLPDESGSPSHGEDLPGAASAVTQDLEEDPTHSPDAETDEQGDDMA